MIKASKSVIHTPTDIFTIKTNGSIIYSQTDIFHPKDKKLIIECLDWLDVIKFISQHRIVIERGTRKK